MENQNLLLPMLLGKESSSDDTSELYYKFLLARIQYLTNALFYIGELETDRFLHASPVASVGNHEIFFTQTLSDFYKHLILSEDRIWLTPMLKASAAFYYSLPENLRSVFSLTADFRLKDKNSHYFLVSQQIIPFEIKADGTLKSLFCVLKLPCNKTSGNVYIKLCGYKRVFEYIPESGSFLEITHQCLSFLKWRILELSAQGYTEPAIAEQMEISINTLKTHKKEILNRLHVANIASAIQWFNLYKNK